MKSIAGSMNTYNLLFMVLLHTLFLTQTGAAKILLIPFSHGSHVNFFCKTGHTLHEAGHDVYALVSNKFEKMVASHNVKPLVPNIVSTENLVGKFVEQGIHNPLVVLPTVLNLTRHQITETFEDKPFMKNLEEMEFDLLLMDGTDFARYFYIIPYHLSVPFISITPRPDPWTARVPSLPSVEGLMPLLIMDEESTIFHRIINTIGMIASTLMVPPSPVAVTNDNIISELLPERENIGFAKLYHQSEMVIINMDIICLDSHRVSSPYYQFVGGIGATDPAPLPKKFADIMDQALQGVIIMTFGSGVKTIPAEMLAKMLNAFKDIKQEVIMRHTGELPQNVQKAPKNVHFTTWMPQNDLLGHPNTKLFITHVGNNGQLEAVYHGVPMLMMPLFGDQFYNSWRAEKRGYGKTLDSNIFTAELMKETVTELIENKTYYNNIKKCSKITHSFPSPQKQILFWVNHILEFGGSHLKPFYLEMPLWKFFMCDVMIVFILIDIVLIYLCILTYRKCCKSKRLDHVKRD